MKHYLDEIRDNHITLSAHALKHTEDCEICATELRLFRGIENGIATLPDRPAPPELALMVFRRVFTPVYNAWHLVISTGILILSPVLLKRTLEAGELSPPGIALLFGFYGVFIFLMLLPLCSILYRTYGGRIDQLERKCDDLLDHPVAGISRRIRGHRV